MKQQSPSLALLREMFPRQVNIDFISAAKVLGLAPQTAYNLVSAKKFPVKTFTVGKRRRSCSIIDLATTLDAQRGMGRVGRPTNLERVARQSESSSQ